MSQPLFMTQRAKVLQAYAKAGQDFIAKTTPYHSTQVLTLDVVPGQTGVLYGIARRNQALAFFTYGVGEQVNLGGTLTNQRATEAETNLAKGTSTNGASDFVIEGVGFSCRSVKVQHDANSVAAIQARCTDADVVAAASGNVAVYDPAAILTVPQLQSPFNLEQGIFQAVLPLLSLEFEWDRKRVEKLGTVDLLPQAGAASYLRANGAPEAENRYRIPEGYLWRRDGQPDSEFVARVLLQRPLVVPLNQITLPADAPNDARNLIPTQICLEVTMRLFGLSVDLPSQN